jgi:hypothetical protein
MLAVEAAEEAVMVMKPEKATVVGVTVETALSVLVFAGDWVEVGWVSASAEVEAGVEWEAEEDFDGAGAEVVVEEEEEAAGQSTLTRPPSRRRRRRLSGETKAWRHTRIVSSENVFRAEMHSSEQVFLALKSAAAGQAVISWL